MSIESRPIHIFLKFVLLNSHCKIMTSRFLHRDLIYQQKTTLLFILKVLILNSFFLHVALFDPEWKFYELISPCHEIQKHTRAISFFGLHLIFYCRKNMGVRRKFSKEGQRLETNNCNNKCLFFRQLSWLTRNVFI